MWVYYSDYTEDQRNVQQVVRSQCPLQTIAKWLLRLFNVHNKICASWRCASSMARFEATSDAFPEQIQSMQRDSSKAVHRVYMESIPVQKSMRMIEQGVWVLQPEILR